MVALGRSVWHWFAWIVCGLIFAAFLGLVAVRLFVGWFSVIPQNGMYPTLPAGSMVFGLKRPYAVSQVARGDIVLFEREHRGKTYIYICRVIGLPADAVTVDGDTLLLNGQEVIREKLRIEGDLTIYRERHGDVSYEVAYSPELPADMPESVALTVPPDHLFVMGDNRHYIVDSRIFGPIPFSSIVGKKW